MQLTEIIVAAILLFNIVLHARTTTSKYAGIGSPELYKNVNDEVAGTLKIMKRNADLESGNDEEAGTTQIIKGNADLQNGNDEEAGAITIQIIKGNADLQNDNDEQASIRRIIKRNADLINVLLSMEKIVHHTTAENAFTGSPKPWIFIYLFSLYGYQLSTYSKTILSTDGTKHCCSGRLIKIFEVRSKNSVCIAHDWFSFEN